MRVTESGSEELTAAHARTPTPRRLLRYLVAMRRMPSPPVVSAAFSGFVVGIVVTLVGTGALTTHSPPPTVAPVPATPLGTSQMDTRVRHIVVRQLGLTFPNGKTGRLIKLTLMPAGPLGFPPDPMSRLSGFRSVFIEFGLYDHPLGRSWRLRAAKADVFKVLKALYTSNLAIYNVEMDGMFPVKEGKSTANRNVLVAYITNHTAQIIPWKRLGREDEAKLWSLLPYHYVDPRFA